MWTGRSLALGFLGALGLFGAVGCGPDNRAMQIQALQEDKDRLEGENADLRKRLADAMRDASDAARRLVDVQRMLDEANGRLAQRPAAGLPEHWEGTDRIAWIEISESILFDSGKIDLKGSARSTLQQVVSQIRGQPTWSGREVWVIGHTDTTGVAVRNQDLSLQRATAIRDRLARDGLATAAIAIIKMAML